MSPLRVTMWFSLLTVVCGNNQQNACPESDNHLCAHILDMSTRKDCYLRSTAAECCNTCRHLADTDMPSNCQFGDWSEGVVSNNKQFFNCGIVTQDTCKYCEAPYHARENCCKTCEKVCGSQSQGNNQQTSLDKLLRALRDMV